MAIAVFAAFFCFFCKIFEDISLLLFQLKKIHYKFNSLKIKTEIYKKSPAKKIFSQGSY